MFTRLKVPPTTFHAFTRWTREMKAKDLRKVPTGVAGCDAAGKRVPRSAPSFRPAQTHTERMAALSNSSRRCEQVSNRPTDLDNTTITGDKTI